MKKRRKAAKIFGVLLLVGFVGLLLCFLHLYRWSTPFRESALSFDLGGIESPPDVALSTEQEELIIKRADPRFYSHNGIDFLAISKAIGTNLFRDDQPVHVPGTQTLTLSVALNLLPEPQTGMEIYRRIYTSYFLAPRLEDHFTKEEIFQLYVSLEDPRHLEMLMAMPTGPNRVEVAGFRLPPLPHHPACGSAPGGSRQTK